MKSCKGVRVEEIKLSPTGFLGDRNWMVIDERGVFVSQREQPKLALVEPTLIDDKLALNAPGVPEEARCNARRGKDGEQTEIELFGEEGFRRFLRATKPRRGSADISAATLSASSPAIKFLRRGGVQYPSPDEAPTSFVDNYGILVISEASREDLNRRLVSGVPMNRFRPNIVVEGVRSLPDEDHSQPASLLERDASVHRHLLSMQPDHHRSGRGRIRTGSRF